MTLPKNGPMRGAKICRNGSESTFRQNNIGTIGKSSYLDPNKLQFHKNMQENAYIYIYTQTCFDATQACIHTKNDDTCTSIPVGHTNTDATQS
jgi:hypothetical protein